MTNSNLIGEIKLTYKRNQKPFGKISSSKDAAKYVASIYDEEQIELCEFFYVVHLDQNNNVLGFTKISEGSVSGTVADVRKIFAASIVANASGIILTHNHPSGNTTPSQADKVLTKQIVEAGNLLRVKVLDHIIKTVDSYYSFADEGLI